MRMTEKKFTKPQSRMTLKRNTQDFKTTKTTGIFSNGIQSNRILIPKEVEVCSGYGSPKDVVVEISPTRNPSPSTSSIYLASHCPSSSDYENKVFNEPDDFELAQFHHERDMCDRDEDWFDNSQ